MQYLGDKSPGATFTFWFTTADAAGTPTALSSGAVAVYKNSDNTESTSGVTLTASADGRTGANRVVIDTSSDGTFYSAGSDFSVVLTAGTVDGKSVVGYVVARFTLSESAAYDAIAAGVGLADGAITASKIASGAITDAKLASGAITADKIASGALTAAKFAAGAFDAVWSVETRVLTAGTNIVLAKGTGITGFNDLDAAGVRSAVGLASANLDAQLGAISGKIDTVDGVADAIKAVTDNLPDSGALTSLAQASALATVEGIVDDILARLPANVDGYTFPEVVKLIAAALLGKASGLDTTTAVFRSLDDTKDRITATVDSDGNRAAVTLDPT